MAHPHAKTLDKCRLRRAVGAVAVLLSAAILPGCDRGGVDSGATANPVAPGRPGTGNGTEVVAPNPTSIPESPQVGGSTRQVPEGVTGSGGTPDYPGGLQGQESAAAVPGGGVRGGLLDRETTAQSNRPIPDNLSR